MSRTTDLIDSIDCILIDDDPIVHLSWKMAARVHGKTIIPFFSATEFFKDCMKFHRSTPIYVDSNLGEGILGEEIAKEIRSRGFLKIFLATGYSPSDFGTLPWITGIVGKDPPWK
jgi:hypothetical protein